MSGGEAHRWDQDLGAYALGALQPEEARELERHLSECDRCRETLQWLTPAVDALPASVEQLRPPRALRRRLLAIVREEAAVEGTARRPWWCGGAVTLRARSALALVASAVLVAGAVGYGISVLGEEGEPPAGTSVRVVRADASAELRVSSLPELAHGDVYQAWVQVGRRMRPSVTFQPSPDGSAVAELGRLPRRAEAILVTREPHGGSRMPTSRPLLREPLS